MRFLLLTLIVLAGFHVRGQVVINELCASNGDLIYDPDYFEFPAWIELHNKGTAAVNVGGYYLSDKSTNPTKWRIPTGTTIAPKGFLLIWCDERNVRLHTNFNLDADGEDVVLSDASGKEIDRVIFPSQYMNIAYGRTVDGGTTFGYLTSPTPGNANVPKSATVRLEAPAFALQPGRFSAPQSLTITKPNTNAEVRYTLDGSEPTANSTLYTAAVQIPKTTVVKAKAFLDGYLPSATSVATYFINEHAFSLPVISLSTKPAYLNDSRIGIYVDGTNGVAGNCQDRRVNWNQNWDRHAVFEYFKDGKKALEQDVDIRIGGACSRNNPQKSLAVKARDKYGSKIIEYKFFDGKDISKFGGLMLRNSGNDFWYTAFRDGLLQSIPVGKMDVDYMEYQPAIVYINGNYWGIMNIREKIDADYIESNYAVDRDDLDLIESNSYAIEGSNQHYNMYLDSLQKIDLSSPEAFSLITRYIDVQEFINYLTVELYVANTDWPGNNVKFWRQRSNNGKFRWILWDLDFGFGLYPDQSWPTHPTLEFATDPSKTDWPNPAWSTLHIRLLLQNPEFRNKFIQTMTTSLETTFHPDRVIQMINSYQSKIRPEMPYHAQRWQINMGNWTWSIDQMRLFATQRNDYMKNHINNFFGLGGEVRLSIETFPASTGTVTLNGVKNESLEETYYVKDLPFDVVAESAPGYKFSHFKVRKRDAEYITLIEKGSNWRYSDNGVLPAVDWTAKDFNDNAWAEGRAQLGYGEGDEATVVNSGPVSNKYITTYFRKSFEVDDKEGLSALQGKILFDDGVVVYFNGEEVYRANMPSGTITNSTRSITDQKSENTFFAFQIPQGKILPGKNVIAVEVHQISETSSDLSFDFELSTVRNGEQSEMTLNEASFSSIANSDVVVEAYFVPADAVSGLIINEIATQNQSYRDEYGDKDDWIEIYNNSSEPIDIANFFVSDKLNNKVKHRIKRGKNDETIIQPGTYKLLWADGDVNQGPLHLSFRLSAEGEAFGIYQVIGNSIRTLDETSFEAQRRGTTLSRIPNITGEFAVTSRATPLAENILEVPTSAYDEYDVRESFRPYPNPVRDSFFLSTETVVAYSLSDARGILIRKSDQHLPGEEISLRGLPAGLYFINVTSGSRSTSFRIIKQN